MIFSLCEEIYLRVVYVQDLHLKIQKPHALKLKLPVKRNVNSTVAPFFSDETEMELKGNNHFFSGNQNYINIL